jgi:uncharacterized delta-60 repeat protein
MKKAVFFLLLIGLFSCSKSSPEPEPNNNGGNGNNNGGNGNNGGGQQSIPPGWYIDSASFKTTGTFVKFIALQKNGKIVASNGRQLARFNNDGSVDPGFKQYTLVSDEIESLLIDKDDKVYIGGKFTAFDGSAYSHLVRLLPDGTIDNTLVPLDLVQIGTNIVSIKCMAFQSNGKLLIGGSMYYEQIPPGATSPTNRYFDLMRLNSNGTVDLSFKHPGTIHSLSLGRNITSIAVLPDNRFYVAGGVVVWGDGKDVIRLNEDGTVDGGFVRKTSSYNESTNNEWGYPMVIKILQNGTVLLGGARNSTGGILENLSNTGEQNKIVNYQVAVNISQFSENEVFIASVNPKTVLFNGISGKLSLLKQDGTDAASLKVEIGKNIHAVIKESDSTILVAGNMLVKGSQVEKGLLRIKKVK